jgi:hypothetical protein
MLRDLRISGFRGFREFAMSGLARVNLLVGTNNCGKTSVLEAIHLLSVPGSTLPLWEILDRRGEIIETARRQINLAHIVHGHEIRVGRGFKIVGTSTDGGQVLDALFAVPDVKFKAVHDDDDDEEVSSSPLLLDPLMFRLDWGAQPSLRGGDGPASTLRFSITRRGGLLYNSVFATVAQGAAPVLFMTTEGLSRESVIVMFEHVVLTPDENTVLRALHTIEPGIERIASIGGRRRSRRGEHGGLAMMVAGQRIPIGTMGDGIWRLLGVALALVTTRGGVLLVDEIDTGLHYSVLVDMWRLVLETARSLDVQVFATTHSRDCYEALAAVAEPGRNEISLQRIERGKVEAIAFSEAEIRQAAERGLEVR